MLSLAFMLAKYPDIRKEKCGSMENCIYRYYCKGERVLGERKKVKGSSFIQRRSCQKDYDTFFGMI